MAHDLTVPDLGSAIFVAKLNAVPIDNARKQLTPSANGVGATFVDQRPRAGFAILNSPMGKQVTDASSTLLARGVQTTIPVKA